jgi:diguanylate cyclase (GGDEF)-like protein/PAS domain S-box-containing protein
MVSRYSSSGNDGSVSSSDHLMSRTHSSPAQKIPATKPIAMDSLFVYDAIPAMLWLVYPDGYTEYCNPHWTRYTGLTEEESQNGGWAKAIHPDDAQTCRNSWALAIQNGTPYEAELRFRRASDGQYRRHLCRAVPKFGRDHKIVYWFGSCSDIEVETPSLQLNPQDQLQYYLATAQEADSLIGQQKGVDLLLRQSEERHRTVLNNVPGMLYQFEMKPDTGAMKFLYVSSGSRALFGLEPEEIEADETLMLAMVAPESRPAFYESIAESARNLARWTWEGWAVTPLGQRKWITCSSVPCQKSNGTLVWDGLLMDSTVQKMAQIQIEMQRLQLEDANLRLSELNRKLDALATEDGLTGLKNRRRFQQYIQEEFQRHIRFEAPLSLIMLDVDKFKLFNDSFGHLAGDEVLKTVARLIKENVREVDFAARYGGEEFIIALPRTNEKAAIKLAERLRCAVANHQWVERDITISVGFATLPRTSGMAPEQLIQAADQALYHSKEQGRNRVSYNPCFTVDMVSPQDDQNFNAG